MNKIPIPGLRLRAAALLVLALAAGCAPMKTATTGRLPGAAAPQAALPPGPPPVAAPDAGAIDAEVARILAGSHSAMPPLQPVAPQAAASVAVIRTENQTPYVLVLRYSGPTSQRLTLKPQENAQLRLAPGSYSVAATAEGAFNVRPFAGVQQILGGTYASSWMLRPVAR